MPFSLRLSARTAFARFALLVIVLCLPGGTASYAQSALNPRLEAPHIGAPRALRLVDEDSKPLRGSFSGVKWETRGKGLFFTRDWNGTRNIWRALPDRGDTSRYPVWRSWPVTRFQAPLFAQSAVPLDGDGALLLVSNVTNPRGPSQVVRFDRAGVHALTALDEGAFDPAASPDGTSLAFASTRSRVTSVYAQKFDGAPRRVALNARRPFWSDATTLWAESTTRGGIFRLSLSDASRPSLVTSGLQLAATRDGKLLCVAGADLPTSNARVPRLFLLAGDGSGLRALPQTEGAQNPAFSGDGRTLAFDAPGAGDDSARALWIIPLQDAPRRVVVENPDTPATDSSSDTTTDNNTPDNTADNSNDNTPPRVAQSGEGTQTQGNARLTDKKPRRLAPPVAQLTGVRAQGSDVAILGFASGDEAKATLEIGEGAAPKRWKTYKVTLPRPRDTPLAVWTPPANARGFWMLRLVVTNPAGAAQNLLSLRLPLDLSPVAIVPPSDGSATLGGSPRPPALPPGGPLPSAPLPNLPAPPDSPLLPAPSRSNPFQNVPRPIPTPRFVPTPRPIPTPFPTPRPTPNVVMTPSRPVGAPLPPSLDTSGNGDNGATRTTPPPLRSLPSATPPPAMAPLPLPTGGPHDGATFNISGTLANLSAGQTFPVTFWGLNTGTRPWDTGGSDSAMGAVRLVSRWVDTSSGNRRKWNLQWVKIAAAPQTRSSWNFTMTAPPRPGRYKLIYGLVRVGPNWTPPAYNAPQESWPNEFAAIAFAVTVK